MSLSAVALGLTMILLSSTKAHSEHMTRGASLLKGSHENAQRPMYRSLSGKSGSGKSGSGGKSGKGGGGKGGTGSSTTSGGGKGGSSGGGGKSDGTGSSGSSLVDDAWVDGEYYGCLALSDEELSNLRSSGLDCDYVIHVNDSSRTGSNAGDSSSEVQDAEENESNGGYTLSYSYNDGESAGTDEPSTKSSTVAPTYVSSSGNDGYTISYYYDDNSSNAGNAEGGNDQNGSNANDQGQGDQDNNGKSGQSQANGSGNSGVSQNSDGNLVVSEITEEYENPYDVFDIEVCDTYEHLWTWDLEISCGATTDYYGCHCMFAEVLMDKGQLTCEDYDSCPSGCIVCSNCLKLLGCGDDTISSFSGSISGGGSFIATAAAIVSLLIGTGCCLVIGRRNQKRGNLGDHLMDEDNNGSAGMVWMVPVCAGLPNETGKILRPVWLAPDVGRSEESSGDSVSSSSTGTHAATASRSRQSIFPDILATTGTVEDQQLPPRGVPTAPTDLTDNSELSGSDFIARNAAFIMDQPQRNDSSNLQQHPRVRHITGCRDENSQADSSGYTSTYSDATSCDANSTQSSTENLDLPSLSSPR